MSEPRAGEAIPVASAANDDRRILFVDDPAPTSTVLMRFTDPAPSAAISVHAGDDAKTDASTAESLDITIVCPQDASRGLAEWTDPRAASAAAPPLYVRYRGVELLWRPGRAVLLCEPDQASVLLPAIAEFAHYEGELRRLEQEIAAAWIEIEQDNPLAFDVTSADLGRSDAVGTRMQRAFRRRIRFARIEPHLAAAAADMPSAAQRLGEELREKTALEARAEFVDGQLEVFEHIYEMTSQRMGEYKAARQGHIMEWVIIVLLAAEAVLMLSQTILQIRH